jgi:hypothetical protein
MHNWLKENVTLNVEIRLHLVKSKDVEFLENLLCDLCINMSASFRCN